MSPNISFELNWIERDRGNLGGMLGICEQDGGMCKNQTWWHLRDKISERTNDSLPLISK